MIQKHTMASEPNNPNQKILNFDTSRPNNAPADVAVLENVILSCVL
jgi:hypothetical protein